MKNPRCCSGNDHFLGLSVGYSDKVPQEKSLKKSNEVKNFALSLRALGLIMFFVRAEAPQHSDNEKEKALQISSFNEQYWQLKSQVAFFKCSHADRIKRFSLSVPWINEKKQFKGLSKCKQSFEKSACLGFHDPF